MNEKVKKQMEQIFSPTTIQLFNLFTNSNHKQEYINNIAGILDDVGMGNQTVRKHPTPMVEVGILREVFVGNTEKVFMLDSDSAVTKAIIALIKVVDEEKMKMFIRRKNAD